MRKLKYYFLLAFLPVLMYGQDAELRLDPYTVSNKFLNQQIAEDTAANGFVANRVYVLKRGGLYLSNAIFRNTGWTLRIRANDSIAGNKPVLMLYPTNTGIPPGQAFDIRGDLSLKNIILTGYYELVDTNINNLQGSLMNTGSPGNSIYIDSCILSNTNGNHIRTDQAPKNIVVTNTIFANMGYLGRSNLGAGKGIDVRAGSVDSLILQNCTFVNWQDRVVRHFNSTAAIGYFKFDHNTLVNGGSYHGMLSLGKLGTKAIITNNVLLDPFAFGSDSDATRQAEFTDSGEKDEFGKARMTWVISAPNDTTQWTVSNNYYAISDSGQAFFDRHAAAGVKGEGTPLTWNINSRLGADSVKAFKKVSFKLNTIPNLMTSLMDWYRSPSGGNKTKNTPTPLWNKSYDMDRKGYRWLRDTLNANIQATPTMLAKLLSSDSKVVGDPRWGSITVVADPNALITVDGDKDAFYSTLTAPTDGYLQLKSSAYNDNGAPKSDEDLSAKIWTAWDNDWFYLYTEVKDDTISGNGVNSYQDDGLELKFDPQAKDSVASSIFAPNFTILGGTGSDSLNAVPNAQKQWARKTIDGGYALELAINWPAIKSGAEVVSVGVDSVFGLAINIHDNDGNLAIGGGRQASIMWSATMLDAVWNTPKYLGTVIFQADHKLAFLAQNNMTPWRTNTKVKYDGSDPSLSVKADRTGVPTEFAVGQNYPNPFNPATTIKYQLPVSGQVTMKVYNFLGQEVATLVNTHQNAAYYSVSFDASRLASGVYFYTLRAGNFVETKKMLLIK